jgi:hypothetical protein
VNWQNWAVGRRGLYYVPSRQRLWFRGDDFTIQYLDFTSGRTTLLDRTSGVTSHRTLAVSPDEKWMLFSEPLGSSPS